MLNVVHAHNLCPAGQRGMIEQQACVESFKENGGIIGQQVLQQCLIVARLHNVGQARQLGPPSGAAAIALHLVACVFKLGQYFTAGISIGVQGDLKAGLAQRHKLIIHINHSAIVGRKRNLKTNYMQLHDAKLKKK